MSQELFYTIFRTKAGWVGLLGSAAGLRRLVLPRLSEAEAADALEVLPGYAVKDRQYFNELTRRLDAYFAGEKVDFPDKLDLSGATNFQRDVWQEVRRIPHGETRSYGWLAAQMGNPKAARAVGQALGRNPLPIIIPCHRVLASDGGWGGFSGGLDMKRFLVRLESAVG